LVVDPSFDSVQGTVAIERAGDDFKFGAHRRPGDVHVHYFGACGLSFGDGLALAEGDVMRVQFETFGRALRNSLHVDRGPNTLITVGSLA
jgi:hypothetical protein